MKQMPPPPRKPVVILTQTPTSFFVCFFNNYNFDKSILLCKNKLCFLHKNILKITFPKILINVLYSKTKEETMQKCKYL